METPPSLPHHFVPDLALAKRAVMRPLSEGRIWLDPLEAVDLLKAYDLPTVPVRLARDEAEAASAADPLLAQGNAVVVKILSRDIVHKSDIGGVQLNLTES